jgi:hypothetical protein
MIWQWKEETWKRRKEKDKINKNKGKDMEIYINNIYKYI